MAEEETYPIPKKEIEIGKGIMIRPIERREVESREEEVKKIAMEEIKAEKRRGVIEEKKPNTIAYLALLLAIISLFLSAYLYYNLYRMKNEVRNIVNNLESFKETKIPIRTKIININQTGSASIPIREAIPTISIPIPPQELNINGTMSVILPGYNFPVTLPWSGKSEISGTLVINTRNLSEDRKINIYYEIPISGEMSFEIKGKEIITPEMEKIINSLKEMSK